MTFSLLLGLLRYDYFGVQFDLRRRHFFHMTLELHLFISFLFKFYVLRFALKMTHTLSPPLNHLPLLLYLLPLHLQQFPRSLQLLPRLQQISHPPLQLLLKL